MLFSCVFEALPVQTMQCIDKPIILTVDAQISSNLPSTYLIRETCAKSANFNVVLTMVKTKNLALRGLASK